MLKSLFLSIFLKSLAIIVETYSYFEIWAALVEPIIERANLSLISSRVVNLTAKDSKISPIANQ